MRERERLEDFRGGHVACRGCKRLLFFPVDRRKKLTCCGFLYAPEPGPVDLVIYDRLTPEEVALGSQALPPATPVEVAPNPEDHAWDGMAPNFPLDPSDPEEVAPSPSEEEQDDAEREEREESEESEVEAMLASAATLAERAPERLAQVRQRGPRYS